MALLIAVALALLSVLGAGCDDQPALRPAALELYDRAPAVDECPGRQPCPPADATPPPAPEQVEGRVLVSRGDSAHAPGGVYLYLEFLRRSGARVLVEVDLPTGPTRGAGHASYREYARGSLVFSSTHAAGRIELPEGLLQPDGECKGGVGFAELRFSAPGADGKLGTADDLLRWIRQIRFGDSIQAQAKELLLADPVEVTVLPCIAAPARRPDGDATALDVGAGCGFDDGWGWGEGGGEGDWSSGGEGDSVEGDSDDSSWEGDDWEDDDSSWEGDDWEDDDSSWEGDEWEGDDSGWEDDDSSWEGDDWRAPPPPDPRPEELPCRAQLPRPPGPCGPDGPALSFLLLGAFGRLLRLRPR